MPIVATATGVLNITVLAKSQIAKDVVTKPLTVEVCLNFFVVLVIYVYL